MTIESGHKDIKNLIIGDNSQFHIPIYQRTYTWEAKKEVKKLIDDVIEFGYEYQGDKKAEYYIGNVILKTQTRGFQQERVVIDGQQRITTVILILCAIRDVYLNKIKTLDARHAAKNIAKALFSENDGNLKLKLNNMEYQSTLTTILTGDMETITLSDKETNYWKNYHFILNKLESMNEDVLEEFVSVLDRVKVVIIFLDDAQDENSVFESINSLGKPLSGSDLIKNYLFTFKNYHCTHNEEKLLTDIYTKNFESLFSKEKNIEQEIEIFFRQYVAVKTGDLVNQDPKVIYYSFKKYVGNITSFDDCKRYISDITKWGTIYQTLRVGTHPNIDQNHVEYLRPTFLTYCTLLMDMVDKNSKVENGEVLITDKSRLEQAIKKVVVYDICRLLGGFPAKQITRFIPTVSKKLEKENPDYYHDYAGAFERLVTSAQEGYGQPNFNRLKRSVVDVDLYNRTQKQVLRFLVLMENLGKKEILSFERDLKGCEIEHIMPQKLTPTWHISEENHERYLHTLGNLSITFNNQGLSNKPFIEKRAILQEKSRINLNQLLFKYDTFDEFAIKERSIELLNMFFDAYQLSKDPIEDIDESRLEVNIFEAGDPTFKKLDYAIYSGELIEVKDISKLYVEIIKRIFKANTELFLDSEVCKHIKLSDNQEIDGIISPVAINDRYNIEINFNNIDKFKILKNILTEFGLTDQLKIKYAQSINSEKLIQELNSF